MLETLTVGRIEFEALDLTGLDGLLHQAIAAGGLSVSEGCIAEATFAPAGLFLEQLVLIFQQVLIVDDADVRRCQEGAKLGVRDAVVTIHIRCDRESGVVRSDGDDLLSPETTVAI